MEEGWGALLPSGRGCALLHRVWGGGSSEGGGGRDLSGPRWCRDPAGGDGDGTDHPLPPGSRGGGGERFARPFAGGGLSRRDRAGGRVSPLRGFSRWGGGAARFGGTQGPLHPGGPREPGGGAARTLDREYHPRARKPRGGSIRRRATSRGGRGPPRRGGGDPCHPHVRCRRGGSPGTLRNPHRFPAYDRGDPHGLLLRCSDRTRRSRGRTPRRHAGRGDAVATSALPSRHRSCGADLPRSGAAGGDPGNAPLSCLAHGGREAAFRSPFGGGGLHDPAGTGRGCPSRSRRRGWGWRTLRHEWFRSPPHRCASPRAPFDPPLRGRRGDAMTILELEAELARGKIAPLYLFYGTERFLMQQALQKLTAQVVDPAVRDFNVQQLLGSEASASQLIDMAAALPMMSRYRLIVVKDAEPLFQGDVAPLLAYLENPVSTTCLV
ncbi:MAG: hypothetical protein D6795_13685, partial [Deltaproteobacteria bacterium]